MKKRKRKVFLRRMRRMLLLVMILITAALLFLVGTLIYINRTKGARYEKAVLSQNNYTSVTVPYRRGDILDCNGTVLATSNKFYNLIIEPKNIIEFDKNKEKTVNALVKYFDVTKEKVESALLDTDSYYTILLRNLEYKSVKPFKDFMKTEESSGVVGVRFEERYIRDYPYGELACHLLGFVVGDNQGLGGLEGFYDEELNGTNGRSYNYMNDGYNVVQTTEPAINGYNVVTSIDLEIQKIVQENVEELQKTLNAKNVSVLVMSPKNCDVLALYNYHQFDPNEPFDTTRLGYLYPDLSEQEFAAKAKELEENEDLEKEKLEGLNTLWRNFVVSDTFEPGSTYKTCVLAGAIENGIVEEDDTFYCDGHQKVADYDIYCSKHDGHGTQDLATSMANSCNDAFMQIGDMMGRDIFSRNQDLFGFGQRTNIDITGEMSNDSLAWLVYSGDRLNEVELATSAFGQGVSITMIQLCTAFCSVINGGYYYQPHIVKRVEDENGNLITNYDRVLVRRTVSDTTSESMRRILQGVVEHGTGWRTQMDGYITGGKTGTAEKLPRNNGKFILSFIGFAPVDNPEVVLYVLVDEPDVPEQDKSSGATVLWKMIAEDLFPYMNIYKTGDGEVAEEGTDETVSPVFVEGSPTDDNIAPGGNTAPQTEETGDGNGGNEGTEPEGTGEVTDGNEGTEPEGTGEVTDGNDGTDPGGTGEVTDGNDGADPGGTGDGTDGNGGTDPGGAGDGTDGNDTGDGNAGTPEDTGGEPQDGGGGETDQA